MLEQEEKNNDIICEGLHKVFFAKHTDFTDKEKDIFLTALKYLIESAKGKMREWNEPFYEHSLRVASILAENNLDIDTVLAGLLHNMPLLENFTEEKFEELFGSHVLSIVMSVKKITGLELHTTTLKSADSCRKMIFVLVKDIRDVFVKLADRLDYIRIAGNFEAQSQKELANEVLYIWTPLANRLGMAKIKIELEDLSLKYTNPDVFAQLKQLVTLKKAQREVCLEKIQKDIYKSSARAGLNIVVNTRAKHFYSIYQKMRKRNKSAEELLDLLAVRVLCDTAQDCYTMVGLVHGMWKPIAGRFKDYIAVPKSNGYQSLHTTVTVDKHPVEIQIRTHEMHVIAEYGLASHWLYKKGLNKDIVTVNDLSLVHNLRELKNDQDSEFFLQIKDEMLKKSVLVFTPLGEIREFPKGATAIDFAYSVHTNIGQTIVGAKANGKIIPLSRPLENADAIEILTNPQAHPTVNQLSSVITSRARSKIKAWLNENESDFEVDKVATVEEKDLSKKDVRPQRKPSLGEAPVVSRTPSATLKIKVGDTSNFMVKPASCCHPQYPDAIVGYVSRGRGIILHRTNCPNFGNIPHVNERSIAVEWEVSDMADDSAKKKK